MIGYYSVIWFVKGVQRTAHTHSCVAADELLELLKFRSATKGDIETAYILAVEEEVYF